MAKIINQEDVFDLMTWLWLGSDLPTDLLADELDELAEQCAADLKGIGINEPEVWYEGD